MNAWLKFHTVFQNSVPWHCMYYKVLTLKYMRMHSGAMSCQAIVRDATTGHESLWWTVYETAPDSSTLNMVTEDARYLNISATAAIRVLIAEEGCYDEEVYEETE